MIGELRKASVYLLTGVGAAGLLAFGGTAAEAQDIEQLQAQMRAM